MSDFSIENGVLKRYRGYGDVVIPEGVTEIGDSAFWYCIDVKTVKIPDSVTRIGKNAFEDCVQLTDLVLPESIREIDQSAFEKCSSLKTLRIPKGVSRISPDTFWYCTGLETVTLPDTISEIGHNAFEGCSSLKSVIIPESVVKIQYSAFAGCDALEHIAIQNPHITTEELSAAFGPAALRYAWLAGDIQTDEAFSKSCQRSISRNKEQYADMILKKGSGEIMARLLSCRKEFPLEFLDRYIEKSALENRPEITAVLMQYKEERYSPEKLRKLEEMNTDKALGFRPYTAADWKKIFTVRNTEDGCEITGYKGYDAMVTVPAQIGKRPVRSVSFTGAGRKPPEHIREVMIEDGVGRIADYGFCGCQNLSKVTLCGSSTEIGKYAFKDCPLEGDQDGFVILNHTLISYCGNQAEIRIPPEVKALSEGAFYRCDDLTRVEIPDNITEIPEKTFFGCENLQKVFIPGSVVRIGKDAFEYCKNLTDIVLSEGLREIEKNAFAFCMKLTKITIPQSVLKIAPDSFECCAYDKTSSMIITGVKGSFAYRYARENHYSFRIQR